MNNVWCDLWAVQNRRHFHESTLERGGSMVVVRFFNVYYDALHFHTGSLKINIFKVLFWEVGGGGHKRVLCVRF